MGALEELGLMEADVGALAHDRLEERRAPEPRRTPGREEFAGLVESASSHFKRNRQRRERVALAEARADQLVEAVDRGEAIGAVAERLGISIETADRAHGWRAAYPYGELPPDVLARLGSRHEGGERELMVEALGGEDEVDALAGELAEGLREAA